MTTIHRYQIAPGTAKIEAPEGAVIVSVVPKPVMKGGDYVLQADVYAIVDPGKPLQEVHLFWMKTGDPAPEWLWDCKHLFSGAGIHLFEVPAAFITQA